ncbi:MAG: carboxypeptidase-like regulatory domain-containing protein, partial [Bacteroidota bacterium]
IMNQLPLIKKLKLRSFVTFRGFYGTLDEDRVNKVQLPGGLSAIDGFYGEAGFGIENIFKIGRVEFLWRLTQRDKPEVTRWGIRLAFQPQF